jgi:hypothetical protein
VSYLGDRCSGVRSAEALSGENLSCNTDMLRKNRSLTGNQREPDRRRRNHEQLTRGLGRRLKIRRSRPAPKNSWEWILRAGDENRTPNSKSSREKHQRTRGQNESAWDEADSGAEITNHADEIQGRKLLAVDTKQTVRRARLTSRTFVNEKNDMSTTYVTPNCDQEFEQQNQLLGGHLGTRPGQGHS